MSRDAWGDTDEGIHGPCSVCDGTGKCQECDGSGEGYAPNIPCPDCEGSGECPICDGSGDEP